MSNLIDSFYRLFNSINKFIYSYGNSAGFLTGLILLTAGIILLFWGYRIKKIALIIIGAVFGISLGIYIGEQVLKTTIEITLILSISLGIICALSTYFIYFAMIFIIGVVIGVNLGFLIGYFFQLPMSYILIISIILAVICGILSIKINKIMFIILTSYYGYILIRIGLYAINIFNINRVFEDIIALILLPIGLIFQFYDNTRIEEKIDDEE
jgi:hypothetical protein